MNRTSPRLVLPLALSGSLLLMLAPVVAGQTDDSAIQAATDATGMTIPVSNCNDRGPGSLRAAVASALSGDAIDMRGLSCRRINLTSGAIMIPQNNLHLVGGGVTVDANRMSSVFRHSGTGTLNIRGMTLVAGVYRHGAQPFGGCLYSAGRLELKYVLVHWCSANGTTNQVVDRGGGIYAANSVTLIDSQVLGNVADIGAGIYTRGHLTARRSGISGNDRGGGAYAFRGATSISSTFSRNKGGALEAPNGSSDISNSTFSDNKGGVTTVYLSGPYAWQLRVVQSTFSGNTPRDKTLVLSSNASPTSMPLITNSTIAFNQHSRCYFATAWVAKPTRLESTIIANNSCAGDPYPDVGSPDSEGDELQGANNLITLSTVPLPSDTISLDPRLAPLADNGGRTRTHALLDDSPAIDMGNNVVGLADDQRGQGYPRVKGLEADIGAYER